MGLFKRANKPDSDAQAVDQADLSTLLLQGEDMIDQLARAHMSWGLGSADRWGLDQRTGLITWTFPEKTATAPAQILGSFSPSSGSWLWAWANKSILPEMSRDARIVRDWAEAHGPAPSPKRKSMPTSRLRRASWLWLSGSPRRLVSIGVQEAIPSRSSRSARSP
jgi:hypothetical protein